MSQERRRWTLCSRRPSRPLGWLLLVPATFPLKSRAHICRHRTGRRGRPLRGRQRGQLLRRRILRYAGPPAMCSTCSLFRPVIPTWLPPARIERPALQRVHPLHHAFASVRSRTLRPQVKVSLGRPSSVLPWPCTTGRSPIAIGCLPTVAGRWSAACARRRREGWESAIEVRRELRAGRSGVEDAWTTRTCHAS